LVQKSIQNLAWLDGERSGTGDQSAEVCVCIYLGADPGEELQKEVKKMNQNCGNPGETSVFPL
jgi:hypothetical protein